MVFLVGVSLRVIHTQDKVDKELQKEKGKNIFVPQNGFLGSNITYIYAYYYCVVYFVHVELRSPRGFLGTLS